jgi:hypothetical protein
MAGRGPLENVSEEQKQNGRTWFGRRLRIFEITRLLKKEPPGRKITLKINKWALQHTLTTWSWSQKQNTKKSNESGINYPGELKR